ncbi:MAG: competence/damage-inducible protein A [Bacteroidetes bacterium 4572_112]|nr:MAG: competence/damage-inducible protein A [Bacteroidetes bacterium 4572_112]
MNKKGIDIISIGDEILIGQIVNTNSSWMADKLNSKALPINRIIAIADSKKAITEALIDSGNSAKLVLVTGGLGPTKDDITKKTVCELFGGKLIVNKEVEEHVRSFFIKRGRDLTKLNSDQALVPDNCVVIFNAQGTAPAMYFIKDETHYVFMPGVPFEMKGLMTSWVIPHFSSLCEVPYIAQKTVLTSGMGESFLAEKISQWENDLGDNTSLAYLPSPGKVRLRISVKSDKKELADSTLEKHIYDLHQIIPDLIYGYNNDTLEGIVGQLLTSNNSTIATAESCTGGLIAHKLTSIAGSSTYFIGGITAYNNSIKQAMLNIPESTIEEHGAVSEEVAKLMAKNVREIMGTDIGISTTGIAGPSGGSEDKPVGTVWIGFATKDTISAKKYLFGDQRERNTNWSVQTALNTIRKHFKSKHDDIVG